VVEDSLAFVGINFSGTTFAERIAVVDLNAAIVIDTLDVGFVPGSLFIDIRGRLNVIGNNREHTQRFWGVRASDTFAAYQLFDTLTGNSGSVAEIAYDSATDSLYVVDSGAVYVLSAAMPTAAPRRVWYDSTMTGNLIGVTMSPDGKYLMATEWPWEWRTQDGLLHVIDKSTGQRVLRSLVGTMPIEAVHVPGHRDNVLAFYTLNRRDHQQDSSTISYLAYQPNILGEDTLGTGANHLWVEEDEFLVVTLNGSHEVVAIQIDGAWTPIIRASTGTTGFDGPRESFLNDDVGPWIMVTTYKGDVRLIDENGVIVDSIDVGGKAESIIAGRLGGFDGKRIAFVTVPYNPDYSASKNVAVIDFAALSVERVAEAAAGVQLEQNFPNPASTTTRVRFSIDRPADVTLTLHSMQGELLGTLISETLDNGTYSAEIAVSALSSGTYLYRLEVNGKVHNRIMKVLR
jgi:hypothetical protein